MSARTRHAKRRARLGARAVSLIVTLLVIALYVLVLTRGQFPIRLTTLLHGF
jgi:hypothetical protein